MNVQTKAPVDPAAMMGKLPTPPKFDNLADERVHRKQRLAAGFRLFSKFGFDEGVAGHITARDPEFTDTFWVNPFGVHFSQVKVSNLIRCDHKGNVVEGDYPVNTAAFVIHSRVHSARPDANAAAHSHSTYGRAFSTLGRPLAPITQDVCAFYEDHAVYDDFGGVAVELDEGQVVLRRFDFGRILFAKIAQRDDFGMPIECVRVEIHLAVETDQLAVPSND